MARPRHERYGRRVGAFETYSACSGAEWAGSALDRVVNGSCARQAAALSRSTDPKRACLIFNRRLANAVTARVLRKFACNTVTSRAAAASTDSSC